MKAINKIDPIFWVTRGTRTQCTFHSFSFLAKLWSKTAPRLFHNSVKGVHRVGVPWFYILLLQFLIKKKYQTLSVSLLVPELMEHRETHLSFNIWELVLHYYELNICFKRSAYHCLLLCLDFMKCPNNLGSTCDDQNGFPELEGFAHSQVAWWEGTLLQTVTVRLQSLPKTLLKVDK